MRLNPLASIWKRLFKRAKSKKNIKKGEAGRVKPMIYLPPGNCRNKRSLLKARQLMIYQMCVFRVEPYDPPGFWGALFLLVCLLLFLKPKNNNHFWAMFFVCFCSAVSLKHPPQRVPKTLKTRLFFLSVFGWFFLFVFKIKHHTKSKETN